MGIFDKLLMTDEEKEQLQRLNNMSYVNALNTHNWELQQKVMMLNAENERLREALKPFANILNGIPKDYDEGWTDMKITVGNVSVKHLRAAAAAIRESGE